MHLTSALYNQLEETGEIDLYSAPVFECIGAPLQDSQGKVFGVLTLYLDDDIQRFAPKRQRGAFHHRRAGGDGDHATQNRGDDG